MSKEQNVFLVVCKFGVVSSAVERFPDKKEANGPTPLRPTKFTYNMKYLKEANACPSYSEGSVPYLSALRLQANSCVARIPFHNRPTKFRSTPLILLEWGGYEVLLVLPTHMLAADTAVKTVTF